MREFTKSVLSAGWGMSLFGAKQAMNMMTPAGQMQSMRDTGSILEYIANGAKEGLGPELKRVFDSGDEMQRRMVDAGFGAADLTGMDKAFSSGMEMMQRGLSLLTGAMATPGAGSGAGSQQGGQAWGKMPPVPK